MHAKLVTYASSVQKKKSHLINMCYQHAMIIQNCWKPHDSVCY